MKKRLHSTGANVFGVFFLLFLMIFSVANLVLHGSSVWEQACELDWSWEDSRQNLQDVESILSEELLLRLPMVDTYGAIQLSLGKHEENSFDTVIDKNGFLYSGNFWSGFGDDTKELAVRVKHLEALLQEKGTQLGVILFPMNLAPDDAKYLGIPYNDFSAIADSYLAWLHYFSIPVLDLRENWSRTGLTQEEAFFKTDHHWTPLAAFHGYSEILHWMEDTFQIPIEAIDSLTNLDNYNQTCYENVFLGSFGRETGMIFAGGVDSYTVIYPKSEGSYLLKTGELDDYETYSGTFSEALLNTSYHINSYDDYFKGRVEATYLRNAVSDYASVVNTQQETAPKILLLRDSYATPIGAFLSQSFSQVDLLWSLSYTEEEMTAFLEENQYDYVFLALYPENLNSTSFPFGSGEGAE